MHVVWSRWEMQRFIMISTCTMSNLRQDEICLYWLLPVSIIFLAKPPLFFFSYFFLDVLRKPVPFFMRGKPIPKRMLPPEDLVTYYTDAEKRGYLADPIKIAEARKRLSHKYGYSLPDITKHELYEMLCQRKDPRQIFFGLAPGWVVNMAEKKILKPIDERLLAYYSS